MRDKLLNDSNKLFNAKDNVKEWFQLVCATKDDRFIIQNSECRIAREPFNIDLWKLYIQFLFTKNEKVRYEDILKSQIPSYF